MKHIFILGFLVIIASDFIAQQSPTGSPPLNTTNAQAASAWYRV